MFTLPSLFACVALLVAGASGGVAAAADAQAGQLIRIDIRGAIAHVTVTRALACVPARSVAARRTARTTAAGDTDAVMDLALPARSELLEVSVAEGGGTRFRVMKALGGDQAQTTYREQLRALRMEPAAIAFDDEARYRVRAACADTSSQKTARLKYTFSTLLEVHRGVARLAFPTAAELSPPPTRVEVSVAWPGGVAEITIAGAAHKISAGRTPTAADTVSTRSPWVVAVSPAPVTGERGEPPRLIALTTVGTLAGAPPLLAYAIGATLPSTHQPLPERILFLIDRSRSVGPSGLEAERDAARKILEALPPTTRFDALFFERGQQRLFPTPRTATREAIAALEDEMVPARLANGTDVAAALRGAADLLKREEGAFSPRCLLVVLTDGAVGAQTAKSDLSALLGQLPGLDLMVAVLALRGNDDPPVSETERRVLRALAAAAPLGGIERSLRTGDIVDGVPAALETLRGGGDVHGIALREPRESVGAEVTQVLEPGAGVSGIVMPEKTAAGSVRTLAYRGLKRPLPLRPVAVDGRWLQPLVLTPAREARLLVSAGLAALVEPVVRPPAAATVEVLPRGYMERSVVRDSLSLAYTPRARACYLNRTAGTAADRDLTGRVRLALVLVRGEVAQVRVESSTLGHAGIEACLRESAFAIEVPRAYRNDEAVTAILNLVFRPRTPERRGGGVENHKLSQEIDLMIEAALKDQDGGTDPSVPPSPTGQVAPRPDSGH